MPRETLGCGAPKGSTYEKVYVDNHVKVATKDLAFWLIELTKKLMEQGQIELLNSIDRGKLAAWLESKRS